MTATALALDPALDFFDDVDARTPRRPQLRLIQGGGHSQIAPARRTEPAVSIELYRRRRFLALLAATLVVLAVAWAMGLSLVSFGDTTAATTADVMPAVHVVMPGDSYAAIASGLGATDPVSAGELLRAANGGSELVVGQRVVVDLASFATAG